MNGDMAGSAATWALHEEASGGVMRIRRPTWRQRLGRWVAGEPDPVIVHMGARSAMGNEAAVKERSAMNELEGGFRFRIIPAANGKIIGYFPMPRNGDESINRIQTRQMGESLYVLKEGEDLLGAIAACLALDRIKS